MVVHWVNEDVLVGIDEFGQPFLMPLQQVLLCCAHLFPELLLPPGLHSQVIQRWDTSVRI